MAEQVKLSIEVAEELTSSVASMKGALDTLQSELGQTGAAGAASSQGVDQLGKEIDDLRNSALGASGAMGGLSAASTLGPLAEGDLGDGLQKTTKQLADFDNIAHNVAATTSGDVVDALDDASASFEQFLPLGDPEKLVKLGNIDEDRLELGELAEIMEESSEDMSFQYKGSTDISAKDLDDGLDNSEFFRLRDNINKRMRETLDEDDFRIRLPKQIFSSVSPDIDDELSRDLDGMERLLDKRFSELGNLMSFEEELEIREAFRKAAPDALEELSPKEVNLNEALDEIQRGVSERPLSQKAFVDLDETQVKEESAEAQAIMEETAGSISLAADLDEAEARQELEETTSELSVAGSPIELNLNIPEGEKVEVLAELEALIASLNAANDVYVDIDINATEESLEVLQLVGSLSVLEAQALAAMATMDRAADEVDDFADEARNGAANTGLLTAAISALSLETTALSLNLGPLNLALGNLVTQVPILLSSIGTLITGLIGIASAAGLAAVGIAGIVAGGVLSEITRLEENFSNIEDSAQALQAIMRSLASAFREALSPLSELNGASDFFFDMVNGLLTTVNRFAQGIAQSFDFAGDAADDIMSLSEFVEVLGDAWFENLEAITESTMNMSDTLLPVFADFMLFIINGFDDFLDFITRFTKELAAIGPAIGKLLDFAKELIDLGSTILQGLLPVLIGLLSIGTQVASMFNSLEPATVRSAASMALLSLVTWKASKALLAFKRSAISTAIAETVVTAATWLMNAAVGVFGSLMASILSPIILVVGALGALVAIGAVFVGILGNVNNATGGLAGIMSTLKNMLAGVANFLLGEFIKAWNSMAGLLDGIFMIVESLVGGLMKIGKALGLVGEKTSKTGLVMKILKGLFSALIAPTQILLSIVGSLAHIIGGVLAVGIDIFVASIVSSIKTVKGFLALGQDFIDWLAESVSSVRRVVRMLHIMGQAINGIGEFITNLPQIFARQWSKLSDIVEDNVNSMINTINKLIDNMPEEMRTRLGVEKIDTIEFKGPKGQVSEEDVVRGTEDAANASRDLAPGRSTQFNYNEENVNNVAQEINADPEEKATLSRVVKDAMEEADSFERRRNGFSG